MSNVIQTVCNGCGKVTAGDLGFRRGLHLEVSTPRVTFPESADKGIKWGQPASMDLCSKCAENFLKTITVAAP